MSMSFSRNNQGGGLPRMPLAPVTSFQYREMPSIPSLPRIRAAAPEPEVRKRAEVEMTQEELQALLTETRTEAMTATEARLEAQCRAKIEVEKGRVSAALGAFERERKDYFARVETEVVRLALSIAAKILHREAQVDPMLVSALVQIAVNQLKESTAVNVRVHPDGAARWRAHFGAAPQWASITVVEDPELEAGDCVLETELGSANFSLAAQLKEVEQGFFDVLAQTPRT